MARLPRRHRVRPSHGARHLGRRTAGRPTCPASRRPGWTRSAPWCATRWCLTARAARPMRPASCRGRCVARRRRRRARRPARRPARRRAGRPVPGGRRRALAGGRRPDRRGSAARAGRCRGSSSGPRCGGRAGRLDRRRRRHRPRVAFTARAAALVDGTPGRALLLNLVGGPDDVQPLLDLPLSPVAVLVESTDPRLARCTALRPVVEAKKAVPPPARRAGTAAAVGIAVLPLVALIGALALTALVVTLLIWLL